MISSANVAGAVGARAIALTGRTGHAFLFLARSTRMIFVRPFRGAEIAEQVTFIGARSLSIIALTAAFTGMVLTLQGYDALIRFGSVGYLGPLVALSLVRELGPVLAALMAAARAGSAMAATIAGMRVSEQIDALEAMAVDPIQYLASTRLLAGVIAVPMLTAIFDLVGIAAGLIFGSAVLRIDGHAFMASIRSSVEWSDVSTGLAKSLLFAVLIVWVSAYQGYHAKRGAVGIGAATTNAVVLAAALILAGDYVMTALLF